MQRITNLKLGYNSKIRHTTDDIIEHALAGIDRQAQYDMCAYSFSWLVETSSTMSTS